MSARYAVYFTPPDGSHLWRAGCSWLSRDARNDRPVAAPSLADIGEDELRRLTVGPARYGFHATLKPPFALLEGTEPGRVLERAEQLAKRHHPFAMTLTPDALGTFLALLAPEPHPALHALADDCVREFEPLRRPEPPELRAKRLKPSMNARQRDHLETWGYPYVFEEFRFHMTLTSSIPNAATRDTFLRAADLHFDSALRRPVRVERLCIFQQAAEDRPFTVCAEFPLG